MFINKATRQTIVLRLVRSPWNRVSIKSYPPDFMVSILGGVPNSLIPKQNP